MQRGRRWKRRLRGRNPVEIVETNSLSEPTTLIATDRDRPCISEATRLVGNYAFFPGLGWRRYWTLADATWNAR